MAKKYIKLKFTQNFLKMFSIFFQFAFFFRISTKFTQNFHRKLKNTLNGMAFDNSFLSFYNVLYFSNIQFFPFYLSLSRMQSGFRKTTPMNMNENCLSQRSLFLTQIHFVNETILLANERSELSLQNLFTEYEQKLTCHKDFCS